MSYEIIIECFSLRYPPGGTRGVDPVGAGFANRCLRDLCFRERDGAAAYRRRDDLLWKSVLEDLLGDFLSFFFPAAAAGFDLERGVEFLDKELDCLMPAEEGGTKGIRHADKLVKVFLKDGSERCLLVHLEVQGQKGKEDFAERMFRYWYRIRDKHRMPLTALATKLTYAFNTALRIWTQNAGKEFSIL